GQFGEMVRPEDSAGLTTPSAPFKGGCAIFLLMSRPPLLFKEGNFCADALRRLRYGSKGRFRQNGTRGPQTFSRKTQVILSDGSCRPASRRTARLHHPLRLYR